MAASQLISGPAIPKSIFKGGFVISRSVPTSVSLLTPPRVASLIDFLRSLAPNFLNLLRSLADVDPGHPTPFTSKTPPSIPETSNPHSHEPPCRIPTSPAAAAASSLALKLGKPDPKPLNPKPSPRVQSPPLSPTAAAHVPLCKVNGRDRKVRNPKPSP
jgi:hypothetical protein